jgi:heme-degrading monooxygenase HmoA
MQELGASIVKPTLFKPMYSSTFTFAPGQFDETFHRLDQEIAAFAKSIPGYLGEENWENKTSGLISTVYYWETLEALQQLTQHPTHLLAKANQGQWLDGYQIVISQVLRVYGDSKLNSHLTEFSLPKTE